MSKEQFDFLGTYCKKCNIVYFIGGPMDGAIQSIDAEWAEVLVPIMELPDLNYRDYGMIKYRPPIAKYTIIRTSSKTKGIFYIGVFNLTNQES